MAKVIFCDLIHQMHGSLGKDSPFYLRRTPSGKTTMCVKPCARPAPVPVPTPEQLEQMRLKEATEAQRKHREHFARIQKMTTELLSMPEVKAWLTKEWRKQVNKNGGKATLRGYTTCWLMQVVKD